MSNKKQSSIEWLEKEINKRGPMENNPPQWLKDLYKQAKAMHEKEIVDAYREGRSDQQSARNQSFYHRNAEQYYNEIYGGNNE